MGIEISKSLEADVGFFSQEVEVGTVTWRTWATMKLKPRFGGRRGRLWFMEEVVVVGLGVLEIIGDFPLLLRWMEDEGEDEGRSSIRPVLGGGSYADKLPSGSATVGKSMSLMKVLKLGRRMRIGISIFFPPRRFRWAAGSSSPLLRALADPARSGMLMSAGFTLRMLSGCMVNFPPVRTLVRSFPMTLSFGRLSSSSSLMAPSCVVSGSILAKQRFSTTLMPKPLGIVSPSLIANCMSTDISSSGRNLVFWSSTVSLAMVFPSSFIQAVLRAEVSIGRGLSMIGVLLLDAVNGRSAVVKVNFGLGTFKGPMLLSFAGDSAPPTDFNDGAASTPFPFEFTLLAGNA